MESKATAIQPPAGKYRVRVIKSAILTLENGVRLSSDIYLPEDMEGPFGTVLERTPYNKNAPHQQYLAKPEFSMPEFFASHGFAFVRQDKRGKYESGGEYVLSHHDVEDADATLNWIASQSWSNGRIGMIGCSYPGCTQLKAAQTLNKHLAALIPQSADGRNTWLRLRGGAVCTFTSAWLHAYGSKRYRRPPDGLDGSELAKWFAENDVTEGHRADMSVFSDPIAMESAFRTLPAIDIPKAMGAAPENDWYSVVEAIPNDWWVGTQFLTDDTRVDVPALHVNGWHDYAVGETLWTRELFERNGLSGEARENQYAVIAPTSHCMCDFGCSEETTIGQRYVGDARFDFFGLYLRWFDHWLNQNPKAMANVPKIQYFNMGRNEWRSAKQWPLPEMELTPFYLQSSGNANSNSGDGRLSKEPASEGTESDSFTYDPADPIVTLSSENPAVDIGTYMGAFDRAGVERRKDVLVFSTAPLLKPLEVTGPVEAILYLSSTAVDTDIDVTLVDVFPDGRALGVCSGMLRARHRDGIDRTALLEPGVVYELRVNLQATSVTFLKDHRIRVAISSSCLPFYERNMGTGGDNIRAVQPVASENVIHHSDQYPSRLVLPVVPSS